jgi:hypothetical protein
MGASFGGVTPLSPSLHADADGMSGESDEEEGEGAPSGRRGATGRGHSAVYAGPPGDERQLRGERAVRLARGVWSRYVRRGFGSRGARRSPAHALKPCAFVCQAARRPRRRRRLRRRELR